MLRGQDGNVQKDSESDGKVHRLHNSKQSSPKRRVSVINLGQSLCELHQYIRPRNI
jgi:hypothetical protein